MRKSTEFSNINILLFDSMNSCRPIAKMDIKLCSKKCA